MPTRKRKWYPGAVYHITARGNHKNDIFGDQEDFEYYITLMNEALEYFKFDKYEIICYCLMDNHVHLLIKTENRPVGYYIGRVNSLYAKYFNKKYNYIGHLFQGRYHSELIKDDAQMLSTSRYIHLNPVRANMVKNPEEYIWSSYSMYIGEKEERLISSEKVLFYFIDGIKREEYKKFVESVIKVNVEDEDQVV